MDTSVSDSLNSTEIKLSNHEAIFPSDSLSEIYTDDGRRYSGLGFEASRGSYAPTTVCVDNSRDVVIGPVTQFHGPVTIYQGIQKSDQPKTLDQSNELLHLDGTTQQVERLLERKTFANRRTWIIWSSLVVLILILFCVALFIFLSSKHASNIPMKPNGDNSFNITIDDGHYIFDKDKWGGFPATKEIDKLEHPITFVVICHTAGSSANTFRTCSIMVQNIQNYHVNDLSEPDMYYNFVICGDGNIYVGRGWDHYNNRMENSIQIAFTGNFVKDQLSEDMIAAAQWLITYGVEKGQLSPDYILVAHNQTTKTLSPGKNVYEIISKWPHFFNGSVVDGHLTP